MLLTGRGSAPPKSSSQRRNTRQAAAGNEASPEAPDAPKRETRANGLSKSKSKKRKSDYLPNQDYLVRLLPLNGAR